VIEQSAPFEGILAAQGTEWAASRTAPRITIQEGRYLARFAQNRSEFEAALRLRFQVFNLELGEGLERSFQTGMDQDSFDEGCHHLIVSEMATGKVVGTYRLQTDEMAIAAKGFYSAEEFNLTSLPDGVLERSVELGRACIDKEHRNTQVLFLLWKAIAAYVAQNHKRYLFGCCSLTSQDSDEGNRIFRFLRDNHHVHPHFRVSPQRGFACEDSSNQAVDNERVVIPRLFRAYLRFGAKVCGPPAIDRSFKTIDFLVLFDVDAMDRKVHGMFFGD